MAWKHKVPSFKTGEPGFTDKLNRLADAVRETRATIDAHNKAGGSTSGRSTSETNS
ncbi:hypothetical protein FHX35_000143 [Auritidibacter ignavus]|nr:hypothetical protein [Auritidibacter ignavus]